MEREAVEIPIRIAQKKSRLSRTKCRGVFQVHMPEAKNQAK